MVTQGLARRELPTHKRKNECTEATPAISHPELFTHCVTPWLRPRHTGKACTSKKEQSKNKGNAKIREQGMSGRPWSTLLELRFWGGSTLFRCVPDQLTPHALHKQEQLALFQLQQEAPVIVSSDTNEKGPQAPVRPSPPKRPSFRSFTDASLFLWGLSFSASFQ